MLWWIVRGTNYRRCVIISLAIHCAVACSCREALSSYSTMSHTRINKKHWSVDATSKKKNAKGIQSGSGSPDVAWPAFQTSRHFASSVEPTTTTSFKAIRRIEKCRNTKKRRNVISWWFKSYMILYAPNFVWFHQRNCTELNAIFAMRSTTNDFLGKITIESKHQTTKIE